MILKSVYNMTQAEFDQLLGERRGQFRDALWKVYFRLDPENWDSWYDETMRLAVSHPSNILADVENAVKENSAWGDFYKSIVRNSKS